MSLHHQPQQIETTVWAAGPQDIAIASHDDAGDSWVSVRVGQVLTYAFGLTAPQSVARIWTVAEERASALLPMTSPTRPHVDGPSLVVKVRGDQSSAGRRDQAFPYDGRYGSAHISIGGILWRPIDCAALTSIADAWRRAAAIAQLLTRS